MGPSINENWYYPYLLDWLDPPISLLKVLSLEVVALDHNVVSPVAMGAARGPDLIQSVINNSQV